jgi:DNA-binding NtrC family response regulator
VFIRTEVEETPMADGDVTALEPERVLIVSERLEERRYLEQLFLEEGFGVTVAGCLGAAVKDLEERVFDLVVSALSVDEPRQGIELAHWIVRQDLSCGVVFISSTFPWLSANSPLATIPVLLRPVQPGLLLQKARSAIKAPQPGVVEPAS